MASSFPLRWKAKLAALLALPLLAGCGGADAESTQTVQGTGYRFEAPAGWKVSRTKSLSAATSGDVRRVEVRTFRLSRPYEERLFDAARRELDGVIVRIATQLDGHVTSRRTVDVDGRRARSYTIDYDGRTQEITFVLRGREEHQLSCRRSTDGSREPCRMLVDTFTLG
jgi:hypothetical protein